jgi:hypothetical protein
MKSRPGFALVLLPVALACACLGANAQEAAPSLAGLAAQVRVLAEQLKQANETAARQQKTIDELRARNEAVVSKLGCVLRFSGPRDFVVDGCNVHIQNGAGRTDTTNSYGNLIIGYNKNEIATRTGSHNLIIGDLHEYTSWGGIVSGSTNTLAAPQTTILSSSLSSANFIGGVVVGANTGITDGNAVIIGGTRNYASADAAFGAVIGGSENRATSAGAVAVGGAMNNASGGDSLACGGSENVASGAQSTLCGGSQNQATALESTVTGGAHNTAAARASLVTGGVGCTVDAFDDQWAAGLQPFPGGCSAFHN